MTTTTTMMQEPEEEREASTSLARPTYRPRIEEALEAAAPHASKVEEPAASLAPQLYRRGVVDLHGFAVLRQCNVHTSEEILNLCIAFPALAQEGHLDFAALSGEVSTEATMRSFAVSDVSEIIGLAPVELAMGAQISEEAAKLLPGIVAFDETLEDEQVLAAKASVALSACNVLRGTPWPIRDQNPRGTCVAHALAACMEDKHYSTVYPDFSEQFLYLETKLLPDSWPTKDGTTLGFARTAIAKFGICDEILHPYVNQLIDGDPGQAGSSPASAPALANAATRKAAASLYESLPSASTCAVRLHAALAQNNRPVAIALRVFKDAITKYTNWNTPLGWRYGLVLDPPPTSIDVGGHAVCVVGFAPSPAEPSGGYFIIRNSWNTAWGDQLPAPGYFAPMPGYGQISATYVNKFMTEMCQM